MCVYVCDYFVVSNIPMEKFIAEVKSPKIKDWKLSEISDFPIGISCTFMLRLFGISLNVELDDLWSPFVTDRMSF